MEQEERLSFFDELLQTNYAIDLAGYDMNFQQIYGHYENTGDLQKSDVPERILNYLHAGNTAPYFVGTPIGLAWIAVFQMRGGNVRAIYILGPVLIDNFSADQVRNVLDAQNVPLNMRSHIFYVLAKEPAVPVNILSEYAIMLHYVLNGERILTSDISYPATDSKTTAQSAPSNHHNGIWPYEQKLMKLFEDGDPDASKYLLLGQNVSAGVNTETKESLRKGKNNILVMLTLISRACIRGGMSPSEAYDLQDKYSSLAETCNTFEQIRNLSYESANGYISRMQKLKKESTLSPAMQDVCYYIRRHAAEDLSVGVLASIAGYSDYYFSRKFKQELGMPVTDYINQIKIEKACLLLEDPLLTVQEISEQLGFCNHGYFHKCFKKYTGVTPGEYREQNIKY